VYLRARDYDPVAGTFTARDPLDGVPGTTTVSNPYHYSDNDPLNKVDPTGERPRYGQCPVGKFCKMNSTPTKRHDEVILDGPSAKRDHRGHPIPDLFYCAENGTNGRPVYDCLRDTTVDVGYNVLQTVGAALQEYAVDTYVSGYTVYWSRRATEYLSLNADYISNAVTLLGVVASVATFNAHPAVGVGMAIAMGVLAFNVTRFNAMTAKAKGSDCVIFSARWWEVPTGLIGLAAIDHFGNTKDTTDATECRDTYPNHVA
jgi:hypothetical protein